MMNNSSDQPALTATDNPPRDDKNARTHLIMGVITGAAMAYIVSNENVRKSLFFTGQKAWSTIRGEVEELKERLEDTQAELEYFRNLHKGD